MKSKFILIILLVIPLILNAQNGSSPGLAIKSNSISLELLGAPAWPIGVTYGQMLNNRLSFELGVGIFSAGARLDVYLTNPRLHSLNLFTGLSGAVSYDAYAMFYLPLGLSYLGKKNFQYSIDGGLMWSPGVTSHDEESYFSPWFGLKVGYRFGEDIATLKKAEKTTVKNIFSLQLGWFDVMVGAVYERLITPFWGLEAGLGFLGASAGTKFYFPSITPGHVSFLAGASESWGFDFWNGSSGLKTYIPIGLSLLSKGNFLFSIDGGPQMWHQEDNDIQFSFSLRVGKAF